MLHGLRFALRMILTRRWFSLAVIATIACGIGVNTMVFTLTNAVFFKPVAVHGGDRLVLLRMQSINDRFFGSGLSYTEFQEYRANNHSFEGMEAGIYERGTLADEDNSPQSFQMQRVSPGLFDMLDIPPIRGRGFSAADGRLGAPGVVLLGYAAWQDRYGGSPSAIGRAGIVNGQPATIIGVMPQHFMFPNVTEMWMAMVPASDPQKRLWPNLEVYGIRKPGVSMTGARSELEILTKQFAHDQNLDYRRTMRPIVQTFQERFSSNFVPLFSLMETSVIFVLLIACANVANMMFGRGLERRQELAIRAAMGASRWQIVRQLLIESVLLSVIGGSLGFALAVWGIHFFDAATQDVGKPYWMVFNMDYVVFATFAGLCIGSGLLFGLAPALRASRLDLNTVLKDGSRTAGRQRGGLFSGGLVVVQFALTLVLLSAAGMFIRALLTMQATRAFPPTVCWVRACTCRAGAIRIWKRAASSSTRP
jgi:putative ABC transport system permease protein